MTAGMDTATLDTTDAGTDADRKLGPEKATTDGSASNKHGLGNVSFASSKPPPQKSTSDSLPLINLHLTMSHLHPASRYLRSL
jgi:hypothetical protein